MVAIPTKTPYAEMAERVNAEKIRLLPFFADNPKHFERVEAIFDVMVADLEMADTVAARVPSMERDEVRRAFNSVEEGIEALQKMGIQEMDALYSVKRQTRERRGQLESEKTQSGQGR